MKDYIKNKDQSSQAGDDDTYQKIDSDPEETMGYTYRIDKWETA